VFVRNLLFETSSSELREAMQAFGDVEQAVLVVDSNTGRPRGTAFVRFRDEASAEKAAAAGGAAGGANSALRAADTAGRIVVGGRPLLVSKAVDRSKARQLAADDAAKGGKEKDPRNLRLAWVGSIKPEAPEAAGLTPDDLKKRAKAEKEKRAKLSHNPNAFVSEVRLSVRNLPRELDEKTLKHMFIHAAGDGAEAKGRAAFAAPKIVHVKILRDAERNGRSKGYGFVQFEKHEHAMAALKKLNNNPKVIDSLIRDSPKALAIDDERARRLRKDWGDGRRLLVEFAVEDRRQVRIIEQIKSRGREKSAAIAAQRSDGDKDDGDTEGAKKVAKRPSHADSRSAKPSGKASKRAVHKAMKGGLEDGVDADGAGASPPKPTWKSLQADQRKEARGRAQSGGKSGPRRSADISKQPVSLKPAKPLKKSRRQAKQVEKLDAKEEKFENLVSAYKRKVASALAGPSSGPHWFD
jgi:nucleolar protein 4